MKKIIQFFSHVLLFISIIGILLPLTYYSIRTEDVEVLRKNHFDTDRFGNGYIAMLGEEAKNLIYNRDYYYVKNDAGINIRFVAKGNDGYYGENYFLIKYKDIAYTNVNNTESTDTIEEIKTFIRNFSKNNIEIYKLQVLIDELDYIIDYKTQRIYKINEKISKVNRISEPTKKYKENAKVLVYKPKTK